MIKVNEQGFKAFMLAAIPMFIFVAYDGIFSIQSILPVIVMLFVYDLLVGKFRITKEEIYVFIIFTIVSLCALVQNIIESPELITKQTFIRIVYYAVIIYTYYSFTNMVYTKKQIERVIYSSIFSGVVVSLFLIFVQQIWFISFLGVQVDKNFVGATLAVQAELALVKCIDMKKGRRKLILSICYLLMLVGIFYTASRAAVLSVILGTCFIFLIYVRELCKSKKKFIKAVIMIVLVPLIAILCIILLYDRIPDTNASFRWYWNRYFVNGFGDDSVTGRWIWWRNAIMLWLERPIWGYGIGNINVSGNSSAVSHNTYIDFFLDQGILGFGVFAYMIIRSVKSIINNNLYKYYGVIITVLLLVLILSATRSTFLWFSLILLYCLGNNCNNSLVRQNLE